MKSNLGPGWLAVAAMVAVALAGCTATVKTSTRPGNTAAPESAGASASPSSSILAKPDFLAKMNAVCVEFTTQIQRLPVPAGLDDYANVAANLSGSLKLFPPFYQQATALVGRSEDKASLTSNWLAVEKSDFDSFAPVAEKLAADAAAKDKAKVTADGKALDNVADHSESIAAFMSGYGLSSCAILERS